MYSPRLPAARALVFTIAACAAASLGGTRAGAEALLLVEVDSGKVLHAENATYPWYPASVTKIMTAYVTLRAVKEGRITLDKVVPVSPNGGVAGADQDGVPGRHAGHARQRAQDADGEIGKRHGGRCSPRASPARSRISPTR